MNCPKCGKQQTDGSQLCSGCGAQLGVLSDESRQNVLIHDEMEDSSGETIEEAIPSVSKSIKSNASNTGKMFIIIGAAIVVIIIAIIVLVMVLGNRSGSNESSSTQATGKSPSAGITEGLKVRSDSLDPKLVGLWQMVSQESVGQDAFIEASDIAEFGLAIDGSYYGSFLHADYFYNSAEYAKAKEKGIELPGCDVFYPIGTARTQDNIITFSQFDGRSALDLTFEYEFTDATQSSQVYETSFFDEQSAFVKYYTDDQLTIHLTGSVVSGPTTTETVDQTFVFERVYPLWSSKASNSDTLYSALFGKWTDNRKNTWVFTTDYKDSDSKPFLSFTMTTPDGKEYKSYGCYVDATSPTETYFTFAFINQETGKVDNDVHVKEALLISFDGDTLVLQQDNSSKLTLTREK